MARSIQGGSGVILVVDVGNSVTNLGLACEGSLSSAWSVTTPDRLTADEALLCVKSFLHSDLWCGFPSYPVGII